MADIMLQTNDLSSRYGHVDALRGVGIKVEKGQIVSIIGANGAGKSTLLKVISAIVRPWKGSITYEGAALSRKPEAVVRAGIVHVPEGRKCFSGLTIKENLQVGGYTVRGSDLERDIQEQYELFPILKEREKQFAGTLSGGEQQMLAVARGMMAHPKLLMLDEPSMGLAPIIVNQIYDLIRKIRDRGVTVLLVEQNAQKALGICDYAYVMENGRITLEGTGSELLQSDDVRKAYLAG